MVSFKLGEASLLIFALLTRVSSLVGAIQYILQPFAVRDIKNTLVKSEMSLTSIFVKYQAIYTILGLISMLIIYSMLPFIISNSLYNEDTNKIILILLLEI